MKITLSMIHERLVFQGYPVSALHGGDQTVKSIHLLPSADTNDAYIRKTDTGVSLTCGQGSFEVRGIPLEAVYDAAQEALRFYTEWELSLIHAVWRGASVQEIIDLAEPVFQNPIFVCTWQGKLLGYTQKYENDNIREFWSILVKEKQVPIFCLKNLRESRFYDVVAMENSSQLLSFSDYGHRCIMGMIHRDHEICLHYQIIEHNTRLTDAMVQLSQTFLFVLQKAIAAEGNATVYSTSEILCSLLDRKVMDSNSIEWMEMSLGWQDSGAQYQLLCFKQLETKGKKKDKNYILGQLEIRLPLCKIVYWQDNTIAITKADTLIQSMNKVQKLSEALNTACGISLPFYEWTSLADAYHQAELALSFCSVNKRVVHCQDHAWDFLIDYLCNTVAYSQLLHPAAKILAAYDAEHNSQLADTLLVYLENERNVSITAEKLFIHRNTMQYRLRKILDLVSTDFENPNIRSHISISIKALRRTVEVNQTAAGTDTVPWL